MNASTQDLLLELLEFQIDEPGTEWTFARRLARENGWSLAYAERVIVEYKKFLYLAVEAGHVVTPSEQVDRAWHLHLTYTRSYWENLCPNVLRRPLHHGPTNGGAVEQARFVDLYQQTLASYRRLLGEQPPRDIWSPAKERFGVDLRHVNVNTERNWIVPKPRWPSILAGPKALAALCVVGLPLATWNPLDWKGPVFFYCYLSLAFIAALLALGTRRLLDREIVEPSGKNVAPLDPYEIAYLAAGPARAVQAAFAAMVHGGALLLDPLLDPEDAKGGGFGRTPTSIIRQGLPLPKTAPRLERALYDAAAMPAANLAPLHAAAAPVLRDMKMNLSERGLLHDCVPSAGSAIASLIMAAPLLLGVAKIAVALERGRPVGFLIAACIATAIASLAFLFVRPRLTSSGREVLASLQDKYQQMTRLNESSAIALSPADLGLTVGLFGAGMLATGPLESVHAVLRRENAGGASATGGGGCGGTSGDAGCGGGGCGGGGCGGCGGS